MVISVRHMDDELGLAHVPARVNGPQPEVVDLFVLPVRNTVQQADLPGVRLQAELLAVLAVELESNPGPVRQVGVQGGQPAGQCHLSTSLGVLLHVTLSGVAQISVIERQSPVVFFLKFEPFLLIVWGLSWGIFSIRWFKRR